MNTPAPSGDGGGETGRVAAAFLAALGDVDVEAMGAVLADDVVFTLGFIRLPGKGFVLRQLPLLLGEVEVEVSEPAVEGERAVARITMDGGALGSLEGEARLVVSGGMVSEVELVLVQVVVEVRAGRYRLTDPAFAALEGAQAVYGELDGTVYRIEVPDDWNGRLVMWAHGFRDFTPDLVADLPPMRALLIEKGYAWASSSFSSNGFVPYEAAGETAALHDLFIGRFGKPEYTYAAGASMGGNAVLLSLELYPQRYDGALAACGTTGAATIDFMGHYAALGAFAAGVGRDEVNTATELAELAVTKIMPALEADPDARRVFESLLKAMTGGSRPFRHEGFDARFRLNFVLLGIARLLMPLDGLFDNTETVYPGAPELGIEADRVNEQIVRLTVEPGAPERNPGYTRLVGAVRHAAADDAHDGRRVRADQPDGRVRRARRGGRARRHGVHAGDQVSGALRVQRLGGRCGVGRPCRVGGGGGEAAGRGPVRGAGRRGAAFTSPLREGDPGGARQILEALRSLGHAAHYQEIADECNRITNHDS